jgi:hypothetical protein
MPRPRNQNLNLTGEPESMDSVDSVDCLRVGPASDRRPAAGRPGSGATSPAVTVLKRKRQLRAVTRACLGGVLVILDRDGAR